MILPWSYHDITMTLPLPYHDLPWPYHDLTLTLPWPYRDLTMTLPWPYHDLTMTIPWPYQDLTMTLPWLYVPWPYQNDLTMRVPMISFWPFHCPVTNVLKFVNIMCLKNLQKSLVTNLSYFFNTYMPCIPHNVYISYFHIRQKQKI